MRAVATAVRAAVVRRRLQSLVVGVVLLLSTGTAVLGVGLLVVSNAPFDRAFARQSGAHAAVSFDAAAVGGDALAATGGRPGVSAAAGPFDTVTVGLRPTGAQRAPFASTRVVGRAEQGGPVDRITLDSGRWLTGPGQIVLARGRAPVGSGAAGSMTVDLPGSPTLRVVGIAHSVTGTADAWVWPSQDDVLHTGDAVTGRQMLYRFGSATDDAALKDSLATAVAGLPVGAVLGSESYLDSKRAADGAAGPIVPFVVAFAVLGLVMSALIVANVVSGAVVAGYRTIGVIKSLGFTPPQVIAVYAGQVLGPGLLGCLVGVPVGNALAMPLLGDAQEAYGAEASAILPPWVDVIVVLVLLAVVGVAAVAAAWRAGRLPAVQAISVGRAPRAGRGFRVRRWLAATRLPRPVSFGLGTPFARPARSAATLLAVLVGAATVVFAVGLSASLNQVTAGFARTDAVPVEVRLGGPGPGGMERSAPREAADPAAVRPIIEAQPGTARVVAAWRSQVQMSGVDEDVEVTGYDADATWMGYQLISGRWYASADEVVAGSHLLRTTGHAVGDTLTLTSEEGQRQVLVVGEILDSDNGGYTLVGGAAVRTGLSTDAAPDAYEIGLTSGTDPASYADSLSVALAGVSDGVQLRDERNEVIDIMLALVGTLTLLLSIVAALGVFNTAVLNTRERTHEIGVLKSIGMTPRQVRTMVIASVGGIGLLAGALAVPVGLALHRGVLPVMADAAETGLPDSVGDVYQPGLLAALGLAGVVLAVLGALVPAGWAARTRVATALRTE
ncbi:FtsX-like permease family protein [Micromonospora sp. LZ34]